MATRPIKKHRETVGFSSPVTQEPGWGRRSVQSERPLLYFSIFYTTKDHAFKRAASTWANELAGRADYDASGGDRYVAIEVLSESDFKSAWQKVHDQAQQSGFAVKEGHLFTHASKGTGDGSGLEFKTSPAAPGDGTLKTEEIGALAKLPWVNDGLLVLHGCNSGLAGSKRNWTPAYLFSTSQRVKTHGQVGYAYFSELRTKYKEITGDSTEVYLYAYRRGKNGALGDGGLITPAEFGP
jgi:hypothetical protein